MAQIRFQIGVPQAGSAARQAESDSREFRSLRPQAGSAAQQAEERSRMDVREGLTRRAAPTTIRMQGRPDPALQQAIPSEKPVQNDLGPQAPVLGSKPRTVATLKNPSPLEVGAGPAQTAGTLNDAAPVAAFASQDSQRPPQTAAGRFKALVHSLFGGGAPGNNTSTDNAAM